MEIAHSLAPGLTDQPTVLTMGKFDGVHLGHRRLISTAVERAALLGMRSAVLTWEPHPNAVIRPGQPTALITSIAEKIALIGELGAALLIVAPFTRETMTTSAEDYMAQICQALPLRELWVGEGFAMGRGRQGDVPSLMAIGRELGFAVGAQHAVTIDGLAVSASRVRERLVDGDVVGAAHLLGRPFSLRGMIVEGDQRGRTIGFPTANVQIDAAHILPADGVYAGYMLIDGVARPAVTNVGMRPTFDGLRRTVEAHILDWSGDLYGQTLQLSFLHRLRGEQKFSGIEALIAQIRSDADLARELLGG